MDCCGVRSARVACDVLLSIRKWNNELDAANTDTTGPLPLDVRIKYNGFLVIYRREDVFFLK